MPTQTVLPLPWAVNRSVGDDQCLERDRPIRHSHLTQSHLTGITSTRAGELRTWETRYETVDWARCGTAELAEQDVLGRGGLGGNAVSIEWRP